MLDKDEEGSVAVVIEPNIEGEGSKSWVDPGTKEGVKKDPRTQQDNITPDMPRYKEVYRNWKTTEDKLKILEDKVNKGSGNSDLVEEMRRHNASLEETIKSMSKSKESDSENDTLKSLNDKLTDLKGLKKQARERADFDTETNIDDDIVDLKVEIRDIKKAIEQNKLVKPDESKLPEDVQEEYDIWISDNEWFTKEPKKRVAAIAFEKKIVREPEFKESSITDILEEVGKRVEEKFKPVNGRSSVEGGGPLGSSTNIPGSIKLSKIEIEIAKGLGVTPESYAKQKAFMNQRRTK